MEIFGKKDSDTKKQSSEMDLQTNYVHTMCSSGTDQTEERVVC